MRAGNRNSNGSRGRDDTSKTARIVKPKMSVGRPFFTFISWLGWPGVAAKMHKSERTKRAQVSMLKRVHAPAYPVPESDGEQDGRRNQWQMLSGNPLARQHIAYRGEIVKEPKIKMERKMEGGWKEKRRRKRSTVDRWYVGQRDEERRRVRRRIWNDGREGQGAKERDGRRKSEEGNGIGTGH